MNFKGLIVTKDGEQTHASVQEIEESQLPQGNVRVKVEYSTLNYKDGLCIGADRGRGLVRNYPHVPGIDFAGIVESSEDPRYQSGDRVVLTGWRVGEVWWGGYAQKACVKADWLVPLPEELSTRHAMAVGTAGLTAMLSVIALEDEGLKTDQGPVLVTGASGGVGSVAIAILTHLGYQVVAVSGREGNTDYLTQLGAEKIMAREEINQTVKRPLESETWAGCVDTVGGAMLARILGQMKYAATVTAVGLVGGMSVPASIIPFLLRGIKLVGIDSVMQPYEKRMLAWKRMAQILPVEKLETMIQMASLEDLPRLGEEILKGQIKGRIVVDVNA